MTKLAFCFLSLMISTSVIASENINPITTPDSFIPLKIKKEYRRYYPLRLATEGNAAVIDVLTMIDEDGQMQHIKVLKSTTPSFNEEAMVRVRKIWFEPATLNGKAVLSPYEKRLYYLPYDERQAVNPEFNQKFKEIKTEFEAASQSEQKIRSHLYLLHTISNKTYYAISKINELEAAYALKFGDTWEILTALENALVFENEAGISFEDYLPKTIELDFRTKLINLYIDLLQPSNAQQAIVNLARSQNSATEEELAERSKLISEFKNKLKGLEKEVDSADSLAMKVELGNRQYTTSEMVRRGFAIFDVKGEIEPFEFYCDAKYKKMEVQAEMTYKIPSSWGNCLVVWQGSENASFVFVQQ